MLITPAVWLQKIKCNQTKNASDSDNEESLHLEDDEKIYHPPSLADEVTLQKMEENLKENKLQNGSTQLKRVLIGKFNIPKLTHFNRKFLTRKHCSQKQKYFV